MAANQTERPLEKEPYYHGLLPREDVSEFLKNEGDFLIRKSHDPMNNKKMAYILSVCNNSKSLEETIRNVHFVIKLMEGKYLIEKFSFDSVQQMVDYHMLGKVSIRENVFIKSPIIRQPWELEHESISILTKLGKCASGEISVGTFKARNGKLLNVAVKHARLDKLTKEQIKEFMAEARVMRAFCHPNVIQLYGVAAGYDPLYMVVELASDGVLSEYLKNNPDIPMSKRNEMCLQAAWGLDYIHSKGYIHREMTSWNCLFHNDHVKIARFKYTRQGFSYQMSPTRSAAVPWLAPETIRTLIFTQKTDVWSYGIFCWEVYNNGIKPYPGMVKGEVRVKVPAGYRMPIPASVNTHIASMITARCWADNQNDRYAMSEVCTNLELLTGIQRPDFRAMEKLMRMELAGANPKEHGEKKGKKGVKKAESKTDHKWWQFFS